MAENALYTEMWKLCGGSSVHFLSPGKRVVYFPQGHLEQVTASTKEELVYPQIPWMSLPSKIHCRVVTFQLLVEEETDEVYAQIFLQPISDQSEPTILDLNHDEYALEPARTDFYSFMKNLTTTDASRDVGFLVPRKEATKCLPPLGMGQDPPSQELIAKDLHGREWNFRHTFRGKPPRHLFTIGWNKFASSKKLVAGDTFVLLRGGDGELRVGVRRRSCQQTCIPSSSVISTLDIYHGVVTSTFNALNTLSMFPVNYRPRRCQFVVGLNNYLQSMNYKFTVGMRFKMPLESEDLHSRERRFNGTIVGVDDLTPQWPKSTWRCLKVQWDEYEHANVSRPERVSPWDIEPLVVFAPLNRSPTVVKRKRPKATSKPNNISVCEQTEKEQKSETVCLRLFGYDVANSIAARY